MNYTPNIKQNEDGSALASVLIIIVIISLLIGVVLSGIYLQNWFIQQDIHEVKARYAAEAGVAVLMDMDYMIQTHFHKAYKNIETLDSLAQDVYSRVTIEPLDTGTLRKQIMEEVGCTKSQFDTALKNLQITMNIVRINDDQIEKDTWAPFKEMYLDVWQKYENDGI